MLASDDRTLIDEARFLSQQARDAAPHYEHSTFGYNYRISNILAAIGRGLRPRYFRYPWLPQMTKKGGKTLCLAEAQSERREKDPFMLKNQQH